MNEMRYIFIVMVAVDVYIAASAIILAALPPSPALIWIHTHTSMLFFLLLYIVYRIVYRII